MKPGYSVWKRVLFVVVMASVGSALLVLSYRISPSTDDRSLTLSEFRSLSKLSSVANIFGTFFAVMAVLPCWLAVRRYRRHRNHVSASPQRIDDGIRPD